MNPVKELLIETRSLLASGWCQGNYCTTDYKYCVRGAFNAAMEFMVFPPGSNDPYYHASDAVKWHASVMPYSSLISWNDHPDTTQEKVLAVFDDLIARMP